MPNIIVNIHLNVHVCIYLSIYIYILKIQAVLTKKIKRRVYVSWTAYMQILIKQQYLFILILLLMNFFK